MQNIPKATEKLKCQSITEINFEALNQWFPNFLARGPDFAQPQPWVKPNFHVKGPENAPKRLLLGSHLFS